MLASNAHRPLPTRASSWQCLVAVAVGSTALAACNIFNRTADCALGSNNCACTTSGACDPGLSCQDGTCVAPGQGPGVEPTGGDAYVRFCPATAQRVPDPRFEIQLGGQQLVADLGQCAPAAGKACISVPAGKTAVKLKSAGKVLDFGTRTLRGGKAYIFQLDPVAQVDGFPVHVPRAVELETLAECSRLDAKEATFRTDAPLELEPFKTAGFTFAKPKGFSRKGNEPHTFVFEPDDPARSSISRFQLTYLGRLPVGQNSHAVDLVQKALRDRGLKTIEFPNNRALDYYAAGVGDSGVPGPGRYVMIANVRHWDLLDEEHPRGPTLPNDNFTAEMAFADLSTVDAHALRHVMKSILWGVSIPPDPVPAAELPGTWRAFDDHGHGFQITFSAPDSYEMRSSFVRPCKLESILYNCASIVINIPTASRGKFVTDGGVVTFHPSRCEQIRREDDVVTDGEKPCARDVLPVTLRMERGPGGRIRLGGLGVGALKARFQYLWELERVGGPPGKWPEPETEDSRPLYGGAWGPSLNLCGPASEVEPNDADPSASAVTLDKDLLGCFPQSTDKDWYETAPPPNSGAGYFSITIKDTSEGTEKLGMLLDGHALNESGARDFLLPELIKLKPGGGPLHFVLGAAAGQRFRIRLTPDPSGWFRYSLSVSFKETTPANLMNHDVRTPRQITAGTPVTGDFLAWKKGTFVAGADRYYTIQLQPGPVTVKLDEVAADQEPSFWLRRDEDLGFTTIVRSDRLPSAPVPGQSLNMSGTISTPGPYTVVVSGRPARWYALPTDGRIPESFTKPYRLTVTQP